ncbi:hypothetical protein [Terasakiella sp. SH-1]|uniref:hypothetical protein n=1 Tax=Terasakiella sp. SH-1 TaxID=2560057 RepID=UPI0010735A16|nr:hypothetical protein [Terasakiella sp. SH-1]
MLSTLFQPKKPTKKEWLTMIAICVVGSILCMGLMYAKSKAENPFYGDASDYVRGAFTLYHHGVFSQHISITMPPAGLGREPAYAFVLSLWAYLDSGFQSLTIQCLEAISCSKEQFVGAQWFNRFLFALSGVLMFIAGYLASGRLLGATIAGGAIWFNKHMQKNMDYIVSDPLALMLSSFLLLLLVVIAVKKRENKPVVFLWALAGGVLAALTLTKAVFYYFGLLFIATFVVYCIYKIFCKQQDRFLTTVRFLLFSVCFIVPVFMWMERNNDISGERIITPSRAGIALNTREVLNHMTPAQYFTSFLYWTRGFGDNWARALLPKEIWTEFEIANPDGFYLKAQLGYPKLVKEVMLKEGVNKTVASKMVDRRLMMDIVSNPITHVLVTIPVFYYGIWVDQFAFLSVPFFFWCLWLAWKKREFALPLILAPSLFNMIFYALISLNIPRYQMTAVPGLALALAIGFCIWAEQGRFQKLQIFLLRRRPKG